VQADEPEQDVQTDEPEQDVEASEPERGVLAGQPEQSALAGEPDQGVLADQPEQSAQAGEPEQGVLAGEAGDNGGHSTAGAEGSDEPAGVRAGEAAMRSERRLAGKLTIGDVRYAVVPNTEISRRGVAGWLRDARREAGLTQVTLAKRLGKSQTLVSLAENGKLQVGDRYLQTVLAACKLPAGWGRAAPDMAREKDASELHAREIAGVDPETLALVRRGSERDKELRLKYVWWSNADAVLGF
jgi:transcriptional regulator with XRE-family HTH domain